MRSLPFLAMCVLVLSGARPSRDLGLADSVCPTLTVHAAEVPAGCVQVSGAQIGELPLELTVGGQRVRFIEWSQRDLASSDAIGFRVEDSEGLAFTVEAGGERFAATGSSWLHPAGVVGPRVHSIDAVTICRMPERPEGCAGPSVVVE